MTVLLLTCYFVLSWVGIMSFDPFIPSRIHLFLPLTKRVRTTGRINHR